MNGFAWWTRVVLSPLVTVMVGACGGGGGGGIGGDGGSAGPRITASVMTFQVEEVPPVPLAIGNNSLVVVKITGAQGGSTITTAGVTANGTTLKYVDSLGAYRGWLLLSTGNTVTLSATIDQTTYQVVGNVPPSYPQIQSPRFVNLDEYDRAKGDEFVSWNGELPNANFHYAVAVLNDNGDLVWPASGNLESAVVGKSTTIPSSGIPPDFPYIAAGAAQSVSIAGAASGSALTMGVFSGARIDAPSSEPALTLSTLAITPLAVSMKMQQHVQLSAVGFFAQLLYQDLTSRVAWSSSAPAIVSVNATGQLTAVSNGMATITAQLNGVSAMKTVTVFAPGALPVAGDAYAYQMDAGHDGNTSLSAPPVFPSAASWSVSLPDSVSYPIITASSVFVLASGNLYAFDAATGQLLWGPVQTAGINYAYDQGRVITVDRACNMQGYDATTGVAAWSVSLARDDVWSCGTVPTAYRGIAYAVGSGVESTVFAVDISSGKILWGTPIIGDGTAPAVTDDGVYVTGYLQACKLDPSSGVLIWHYVGAGQGGGRMTAAVEGNQVYMRGYAGTPNLIFDSQSSLVTGTFNSSAIPAFGNGAAYFLDSTHTLKATSLAGQATLWTATDPSTIVATPIVVNNVVITGTASGLLKAYDALTGNQVWSVMSPAPLVAADDVDLAVPLTGMAAAHGLLAVSSSNVLSVYRLTGP